MNRIVTLLNHALTAGVALLLTAGLLHADEEKLDELFERLAQPELAEWEAVEQEIFANWSRSGSPAMDLLLQRGREAMNEGDFDVAIDHFSALIDHAPDFAEGYNARATAYFHAGRFGQSISDIERTLALNPRHFGAMSGMGNILNQLGLYPEALEIIRRARTVHPHRPDLIEAQEHLEARVDGTSL